MNRSFLFRYIGLASFFFLIFTISIPHFAFSEDSYLVCIPLQDCLKRAEQGDIRAQARLGALYFNGGDTTDDGKKVPRDYKKALMWRMKAAEQGHVLSQYDLGIMYYLGNGVEQNIGESYYWLTKAAEQGYSRAQYSLGMMHGKGEYVPKNYNIAHMWLLKAAIQGEPTSQLMLGHMYKQGLGVSVDHKQAYAWFHSAAEHGNEEAAVKRDKLGKLLEAQNKDDYKTAKELAQQYSREYDSPFQKKQNEFYKEKVEPIQQKKSELYGKKVSKEFKEKYEPVLDGILKPMFKKHYKRTLIVSLLELCNETELTEKYYEQDVIGKEIDTTIKDATDKFSLSENEQHTLEMMFATFIGGFREGYRQAVLAAISSDEEKTKLCSSAREQAVELLKQKE